MSRSGVVSLVLLCLVIACSSDAVAASKYIVKQDPQAVAIAAATFAAMGGAQAILGYQDSLASGTIALYHSGGDSYPITLKSKGLRATRLESQGVKGTSLRIVNDGQGAMVRADGTVKVLDSNNTFYEHVTHVPLLSLLSQYATANVDLKYDGVQKIQDQSEDVIDMDFVFNDDPVNSPIFASRSRTLVFVNQATKLVDKIETHPLYEGDPKDTVTEDIVFDDYRSVDGMLVPFHVSVFSDNKLSVELKLDNFKINVGLPDSDFELPKGGGK